ncbi:MAG TPA: group 1 truncated hemoglobin, partial [Gammaproteobacteria bacterium]|nr:group 1 truncated hemoglobin [Gammaproteobacteria bacterium]
MKRINCILLALGLSFCVAAAAQPRDDSLYVALGGEAGITVIVDTMLSNVADDTRIVHFFANTNIAHVRHGLVTKFCAISGGPCTYDGLNMADTHRGLHITAADFNA